MTFTDFSTAWVVFLTAGFLIALVMGAVVNKTGFCTMGGVSDWVNMGDTSRMRAWLLAMGVAILGVTVFEYVGIVQPNDAMPPYRMTNLVWLEHLLGGLIFGVGMTLASGCGNKTLVRFGAGNMKSLVVIAIIAVVAYFMVNPFPGTDMTLFSTLFYPWTSLTSIELGVAQDLGTLIGGEENAHSTRLTVGLIVGAALVIFAVISAGLRSDRNHWLSGLVVGLAVVAAWIATSVIVLEADGDMLSMPDYYAEWDMYAEDESGKPSSAAPLAPQSYTFINPMGQSYGYFVVGKGASSFLTFGLVAAFGVIVGSFLWALYSKTLRFEWFVSFKDFYTHVIGAVLMAVGGVLGMGCTVGQGVTGVSTLAVGSIITVIAIMLGSALTMKAQFYKMMYEEEASTMDAVRSAMVDLRLLPNSLRTLDKV